MLASLVIIAVLAIIVVWLGLIAHRRADGTLKRSWDEGRRDFLRVLLPVTIGMLGAGYIAELMPPELVRDWLGTDSGFIGVAVAALAGAATPGGPVVGFSIGAAALKAGAGLPQVLAYTTAWSLFTINRILIFEIPALPRNLIWFRIILSMPVPFIVAGLVVLAQPYFRIG